MISRSGALVTLNRPGVGPPNMMRPSPDLLALTAAASNVTVGYTGPDAVAGCACELTAMVCALTRAVPVEATLIASDSAPAAKSRVLISATCSASETDAASWTLDSHEE